MVKRPSPSQRPRHGAANSLPPAEQTEANSTSRVPSSAAVRETVESIIVAFVLAFLFRTFEAEAFVIPTGSMAPTLMGQHKDLYCPKCDSQYQVNASERTPVVTSGTCPMCRFPANLATGNPNGKYPTFNGDRILVSKFAYEFEAPRRWDVIVFKYPEDPTTNYIKRLVGLPGETIRVSRGDLWIRKGDDPFEIARKESPQKLRAMQQLVFDNDFAPKIAQMGWPARWQPEPLDQPGGWSTADGALLENDGSAADESWVRYRHYVPTYGEWLEKEDPVPAGGIEVRPKLIADFTAYNTGSTLGPPRPDSPIGARPEKEDGCGLHWVGDLAVECTLEAQSAAGEVVFELVRGGRKFQCRMKLSDGEATLGIQGPDAQQFAPTAKTPVVGPGEHKIMFSNIDDQLRLFVDGREMAFVAPTTYDSDALDVHVPRPADLSPVGIASRGAAIRVSHLKIYRDIYYIADEAPGGPTITDYRGHSRPDLARPETWPLAFDDRNMNVVEFPLAVPEPGYPERDRFLVMGDNSAQSKDSRLWGVPGPMREYWVTRDLLVGKALLIYWPHSWDQLPGTPIPFPFFPNFQRMLHLVR